LATKTQLQNSGSQKEKWLTLFIIIAMDPKQPIIKGQGASMFRS
jgi:hypothetical protein